MLSIHALTLKSNWVGNDLTVARRFQVLANHGAQNTKEHFTSSVNTSVYFSKTLAIGLCPVEPTKRETDRVCLCPTESIRQHFTPSVNTSVYFTKSLAIRLCPVEPTQRETDCVRPCPRESICQHFTPSVNTSMYFPKSLAIGLPVSRTVAYPRRSDSVRVYWTCMK